MRDFYNGFRPIRTCTVSWLGIASRDLSLLATTPTALRAFSSASAAGESWAAWSSKTWMLTPIQPCCPIFGLPATLYTFMNGPDGWLYSIHVQPADSKLS